MKQTPGQAVAQGGFGAACKPGLGPVLRVNTRGSSLFHYLYPFPSCKQSRGHQGLRAHIGVGGRVAHPTCIARNRPPGPGIARHLKQKRSVYNSSIAAGAAHLMRLCPSRTSGTAGLRVAGASLLAPCGPVLPARKGPGATEELLGGRLRSTPVG